MDTNDLDTVWRALSDPTRRRILDLLRQQPRTTGDLCGRFELSRFAVMKHLGVLEEAGLIAVRRRGRERWNHLNPVPIRRIYDRWMRPYEEQWSILLLRLQGAVEGGEEEDRMAEERAAAGEIRLIRVEQDIKIAASPERVWNALTDGVSAWWGPPYTCTESPRSITLEARLGGSLREQGSGGEEYLWGVVSGLTPGRRIELTGRCGMAGVVHGVFSFTLEPDGETTRVALSHHAFGEIREDTAACYGAGWTDLLDNRLRAHVERGERPGLG